MNQLRVYQLVENQKDLSSYSYVYAISHQQSTDQVKKCIALEYFVNLANT